MLSRFRLRALPSAQSKLIAIGLAVLTLALYLHVVTHVLPQGKQFVHRIIITDAPWQVTQIRPSGADFKSLQR